MTASGIAMLTDPPACAHLVFPCTDEQNIVDAITVFASAGLEKDEAVVLIATQEHCNVVTARLEAQGFNIKRLQRSDQLICLPAAELLCRFMINGQPDEKLFVDAVEEIVDRARMTSRNGQTRKVRAFGEMVSLLWRVDVSAAIRLEALWNGVIEEHQLALLCTYSLDGTEAHRSLPECLISPHSHDLTACAH